MEKAIFAGGCFWCTEAVFQNLEGVSKVVSGYMGGDTLNPSYKEICTGTTGHAEVIEISFDPEIISFEVLLEIFWTTHDPTTLNRQGNDRGTQYRSAIFYTSEAQKDQSEHSISTIASEIWDDPIVTEVVPETTFYPAESYHQNYYQRNGYAGYCRIIISPKIAKLKSKYSHLLKSSK